MVMHSIDCCDQGLMKFRFLNRWGIGAVFPSTAEPVLTAPYNASFTIPFPCTTAIWRIARPANQNFRQCIFAGVNHLFLRQFWELFRGSRRSASGHLILNKHKCLAGNNSRMTIFYQILREFSFVFLSGTRNGINGISLLQQCVTCIFFISENVLNSPHRPNRQPSFCYNALIFQHALDVLKAFT